MVDQYELRQRPFRDDRFRDQWEQIQAFMDFVVSQPFMQFRGRAYEELDVSGTQTFSHGLGFRPFDFLVTRNTAGTSVTFDQADETTFTLTVGATTSLRFLLGRFTI